MAKGQPFSVRLQEETERLVEAEARRTRRTKSAAVEAFTVMTERPDQNAASVVAIGLSPCTKQRREVTRLRVTRRRRSPAASSRTCGSSNAANTASDARLTTSWPRLVKTAPMRLGDRLASSRMLTSSG